jgi:hypothetical protein
VPNYPLENSSQTMSSIEGTFSGAVHTSVLIKNKINSLARRWSYTIIESTIVSSLVYGPRWPRSIRISGSRKKRLEAQLWG